LADVKLTLQQHLGVSEIGTCSSKIAAASPFEREMRGDFWLDKTMDGSKFMRTDDRIRLRQENNRDNIAPEPSRTRAVSNMDMITTYAIPSIDTLPVAISPVGPRPLRSCCDTTPNRSQSTITQVPSPQDKEDGLLKGCLKSMDFSVSTQRRSRLQISSLAKFVFT